MFFLGAVYAKSNNLATEDVLVAIYAVVYAGMIAGNKANFLPDLNEVQVSAAKFFRIIDGKDEDQLQKESGSKMLTTPIKGNIEFKGISYAYEGRN